MRLTTLPAPTLILVASLACGVAQAQPVTIKAGHTVLTLPADMRSYAAPLSAGATGGDSVRIARQVILLSSATDQPVAAVLIESTREAGRYIWWESCKKMKNDAHTFVDSPFHAMGNECVFAVGLVDLAAVIGSSFADVGKTLREGNQPALDGPGYIVRSSYASSSGSMLSATVMVRRSFARLATPPESYPDDTGVPVPVVAWARALNAQVRGAMRSFSGEWQLPPLVEARED